MMVDGKRIVKDGYNQIAAQYLAIRDEYSADVRLLEDFVQRLPKNATLLDAGCGAGVPITRYLSRYGEVTGVDFSEAQIALARQAVPQARFICQDITALDFPDEAFDAICSYYAIIHIPREQHRAVLQNFHRMLKPSGLALLCMGNNDLLDDVEQDYFGAPMYWSHYDGATNLRTLVECGLEIIWAKVVADNLDPNATHLFVLAQKEQRISS